jgi:hypothetical protein
MPEPTDDDLTELRRLDPPAPRSSLGTQPCADCRRSLISPDPWPVPPGTAVRVDHDHQSTESENHHGRDQR